MTKEQAEKIEQLHAKSVKAWTEANRLHSARAFAAADKAEQAFQNYLQIITE